MIKKSILIRQSFTLKNYNTTFTKINSFLFNLKYSKIEDLKRKLISSPTKKRLLLLNILNKFNNIIKTSDLEYLIIKIFANKGIILKKFQAQAKGKGVQIKKKSSHITVILSQIKLYKTFIFSNLII